MQVIRHVDSGKTLARPAGCPDEVHQLMLGCWRRPPKERLPIAELHLRLSRLVDTSVSLGTTQRLPNKHALATGNDAVVTGNASLGPLNGQYLELVSSSAETSFTSAWYRVYKCDLCWTLCVRGGGSHDAVNTVRWRRRFTNRPSGPSWGNWSPLPWAGEV